MGKKTLFIKPPDLFLENEFVYPQLGPHYLQSYLQKNGVESDILVLYMDKKYKDQLGDQSIVSCKIFSKLRSILIKLNGDCFDGEFDHHIFEGYDFVGLSVMTPQAPVAYELTRILNRSYAHITTVIGGSHARYYQKQVMDLPADIMFDFVVPGDGWEAMLEISTGLVHKQKTPVLLSKTTKKLKDIPAPTRPVSLMEKYSFEIAGVPAAHTITALGCPFTCHFCESGLESVRTFSSDMINLDLQTISSGQDELGYGKKAVMFFDDVGLMSPKQVERLSKNVEKAQFNTWRAFTHAYLLVRHKELLLRPFIDTGGKRIGIGLETGSQKSLDLINKRNGQKQLVDEHYEAVKIANSLGVAVDAFTMIYPWEDEKDLEDTNRLVEFVAANKVMGIDEKGRPLLNHVDSTIMSPYQGTKFYDMINIGELPDVEIDPNSDPGRMYYKGVSGGSGWPYTRTYLPKHEYYAAQNYRNSFRPKYR